MKLLVNFNQCVKRVLDVISNNIQLFWEFKFPCYTFEDASMTDKNLTNSDILSLMHILRTFL